MNHYVYEITNKLNNKKYIGKRSCFGDIQKDNYYGSGILIKKAINKYGIENFKKDIIYIAETEEEALSWEKYIIKKYNICKDINYYNIASGGLGGDVFKGYTKEQLKERNIRIRDSYSGNKNSMYGKRHTDFMSEEDIIKWKSNISKSVRKLVQDQNHIKKISETLKGDKNPMYGKRGEDNPNFGKKRSKKQKEYMSKKMKEAYEKKLLKEAENEKNVLMYDLNDNLIAEFPSSIICSRKTGLRHGCIKEVLGGNWKKYKQYKFKYKE